MEPHPLLRILPDISLDDFGITPRVDEDVMLLVAGYNHFEWEFDYYSMKIVLFADDEHRQNRQTYFHRKNDYSRRGISRLAEKIYEDAIQFRYIVVG